MQQSTGVSRDKHHPKTKTIFRFFYANFINHNTTYASEKKRLQHDEFLIDNATIINPYNQSITPDGWLHIKNGMIFNTGTGTPPAIEKSINLNNAYVTPGFIDSHLHLTAGPLKVSVTDGVPAISLESIDEVTEFHALSALASGITSAFSPAGDPEANYHYAQSQQQGDIRGPALDYAGLVFDPVLVKGGSVYPADEQSWREEIQRQKSLGVSHIKLYHGLNLQEIQQGVKLANEAGLKTIAHLDTVSWKVAVQQGVDALTHALMTSPDLLPQAVQQEFIDAKQPGSSKYLLKWFELVDFQAPEFRSLVEVLVVNKTRVDLTLIVNEMMFNYSQLATIYPDNNWQAHPEIADSWKQNLGMSLHDWTEEDFKTARNVFPKVLELARIFHSAGVNLLIGTDSYSGGTWLSRELKLHQLAGVNNWDLLQRITSHAAEQLAFNNKGRIEPGYHADLIVLTQNPLRDIDAINTVSQIVQAGVLYEVALLKAELEQRTEIIRRR